MFRTCNLTVDLESGLCGAVGKCSVQSVTQNPKYDSQNLRLAPALPPGPCLLLTEIISSSLVLMYYSWYFSVVLLLIKEWDFPILL